MNRGLFWLSCISLLFAISRAAAQDRIFPKDAVVDVTAAPYGAKPDDGLDDTAAIQRAITANVGTGRVLYFPAGVYEISETLVAKDARGIWNAKLTLQGQNRTKTVLRLRAGAKGFDDPQKPKAMLMTGSTWEQGDSEDGGGNKAFCNNLFDLAIDTGNGHDGAIGVEYAVSNCGAIERVNFRGNGVAAIAMKRRLPGPGLVKDVAIEGFEIGIDLGDGVYGMTLENLRLSGQRSAGICTERNVLHILGLQSDNRGPAVVVSKANGVVTLVDSVLAGGTAEQFALECAGSLMVRNVKIQGYRPEPLLVRGKPAVCGAELTVPPALGSRESGELLDAEETPEYWNANLADWEAIGARADGEQDDTAAIQRAMDSGKSTIYFPNNRVYFLSDTVRIGGAVRQILGLGSEISLGASKEPFSNKQNPRPLFRLQGGPLVVDGLFFNAQYPGEVLFENGSAADFVIQHCAGWVGAEGFRRSYRNTSSATGRVFLEDVFLPGWEFRGQKVWARQFNPENPDGDGTTAQVSNIGGELWILGFKTEGPAPFLVTGEGGKTEMLGGYNYISATNAPTVPSGAVPYVVEDGVAALTFVTDNFRNNDYLHYIKDGARLWAPSELPPRNGVPGDRSLVVPLFRSGGK